MSEKKRLYLDVGIGIADEFLGDKRPLRRQLSERIAFEMWLAVEDALNDIADENHGFADEETNATARNE